MTTGCGCKRQLPLAMLVLSVCCAAVSRAASPAGGPGWRASAQKIVVSQAVLIRGTLRDIPVQDHRDPPLALNVNGQPVRLWGQTICRWEEAADGQYNVMLDLYYEPSGRQYFFDAPGRYEIEVARAEGGEVIFSCRVDVSAPPEEDKGALPLMQPLESVRLLLTGEGRPEDVENLTRVVEEFPASPWRPYAETALGMYYFEKAGIPPVLTVEEAKRVPERRAALAKYFRAAAADEALGLCCWKARFCLAHCLALGKRYEEALPLLRQVAEARLPGLSPEAQRMLDEMERLLKKQNAEPPAGAPAPGAPTPKPAAPAE